MYVTVSPNLSIVFVLVFLPCSQFFNIVKFINHFFSCLWVLSHHYKVFPYTESTIPIKFHFLTFKSLIHLKIFLMIWGRNGFNLTFSKWLISSPALCFSDDMPLLPCTNFHIYLNIFLYSVPPVYLCIYSICASTVLVIIVLQSVLLSDTWYTS